MFILALAISIALGVMGQLGLKAGVLENIDNSNLIPHPYVIGGLFFYSISAGFYIYALRNIPVSVAFPSISLSYVAVAYLASIIWGEAFGWHQIVALAAIGFGVWMLFQYR